MTKKKMTVRVTDELSNGLREMSKKTGQTKNSLIVNALWDLIEKRHIKNQAGGRKAP